MRAFDYERQYGSASDQRSPGQKDRDRVLYTHEFRRLAGITQVLTDGGHAFHNRLTHTLEVAQVARRMAELMHANECRADRLDRAALIDADVVEAAALIHDLGHPPFGHLGEHELDALAREAGDEDGFEGNAQSFRIVTRLAVQSPDHPGLNLTRATLRASLKYPNLRVAMPEPNAPDFERRLKQHLKFGAYREDAESFFFAVEGAAGSRPSLEAQIMDFADDIAYSMSDLLDFYKAGMLPLHELAREDVFAAFFDKHKAFIVCGSYEQDENRAKEVLLEMVRTFDPTPGFDGSRRDMLNLRQRISDNVGRYVRATVDWDAPEGPELCVDERHRLEIAFFKRVMWEFVISHSSIHTQREGHALVVRRLFQAVLNRVRSGAECVTDEHLRAFIPSWYWEGNANENPVRLAVDVVASLSDAQALALDARLSHLVAP
ncbi:deoxyguanosinetriphosphate triphosphohydrolase family protein [Deinococcus yavapaiensis]|uniref:dGTPase n=1 Tax=Deinococcus yavapaiensis KR-236 TaxID=694435 RepID=A0A318S5W9_9DEIO|nr:dNTP triphosphohydrolase [Deinococcus yavapaiensis]PYE54182.1 dGTPase [Deinococcus yavapaiensis KR-236]